MSRSNVKQSVESFNGSMLGPKKQRELEREANFQKGTQQVATNLREIWTRSGIEMGKLPRQGDASMIDGSWTS